MCRVCDHPQREAIDRAIIAGDSLRKIATMFATSKDAIHRHKNICMKRVPGAIVPVAAEPVPAYQTPAEMATASQNVRTVAQRVGALVDKMEALAQRFEETGDTNGIMRAAKEIREGLRLMAQLSGELGPNNQVNLQVNVPTMRDAPEWPIIVRVIERHPEIREELNAALLEVHV